MDNLVIEQFATELILLFIGVVLSYIALKIRKADNKLTKMERVLYGFEELDEYQGIIHMVQTHRTVLKNEDILEEEEFKNN